MSGVAPWLQRHWDWRAAGNFTGGGTGTGLYATAAVATLFGADMLRFGLLGLAFVGLGLFCVWLETGRPLRAPLNVFFNAKTSWMTREAIVALPLFALGTAGAFLGWPALALLAAAVALGFLYCQARILKASKGIPAWREPLIVPLTIATGLTEGTGLFLFAAAFLFPNQAGSAVPMATGALLILLTARAWAWMSYRRNLAAGAPTRTLKVLDQVNLAVMATGHVVPVVLVVMAVLMPEALAYFAGLAGLAAMLAGWHIKFTIVTRAAYNQGYAIVHAPERGAGGGGPGTKPGWN